MTAITTTATSTTTRSARRTLWLAGLASGAVAAVATTVVAAVADATDHPLLVDGEKIPVAGFAQMTVIGTIIGVVLALVFRRKADRPRRTFVRTTSVLTAVSCVPSVAMGLGDGVGNTTVLVATHVIAAAIVVPVLAARVPAER